MIWIISIALAGYLGFLVGQRWEIGQREVELEEIEEQKEARGQRPGTIKLSTVRIRR